MNYTISLLQRLYRQVQLLYRFSFSFCGFPKTHLSLLRIHLSMYDQRKQYNYHTLFSRADAKFTILSILQKQLTAKLITIQAKIQKFGTPVTVTGNIVDPPAHYRIIKFCHIELICRNRPTWTFVYLITI
jgi:hypothetical protein